MRFSPAGKTLFLYGPKRGPGVSGAWWRGLA
jgi:hypothetical protein